MTQLKSVLSISTLCLCISVAVDAAVIPSVVNVDTTLPAGDHVISNDVAIVPGVTLTVNGPSTVVFVRSYGQGSITVSGAFVAADTVFVPEFPASNQYWGTIFAVPGSSISFEHCSFRYGGYIGLSDSDVIKVDEAVAVLDNCEISSPRRSCLSCTAGSDVTLYSNSFDVIFDLKPRYGALIEFSADRITTLQGSDNTFVTNGGLGGVCIYGVIANDMTLAMPNSYFNNVGLVISNATVTIAPGTIMTSAGSSSGFGSAGMDMYSGAILVALGTEAEPISFINNRPATKDDHEPEYLWRDLYFHPGTTGYLDHVTVKKAGLTYHRNIGVENAHLVISNGVLRPGHSYGIEVLDAGSLVLDNVDIQYFNMYGVKMSEGSKCMARQCVFDNFNVSTGRGIQTDGSCDIDARYCWWGDATGPYPYGDGVKLTTNGNVLAFPWLVAPPGSQTNPPNIEITSHTGEPIVVSEPQILLKGIATDDGEITRVEFRNLNRKIVGNASMFGGTSWWANIWLFEGENQIGLTAYDNEGNATVVGTIVDCTGDGCGDGGATTPSLNPLPDRTIPAGELLEFGVVASSATEPAVLTYWADNLPAGAEFDQIEQKFSWTPAPADAGVHSDIAFFVTDGTHVGSNTFNLTVTAVPAVNILTEVLPDAYIDYPYYAHLAVDVADGPVTWDLGTTEAPRGMFASRAGIICGTPFGFTGNDSVTFTITAKNSSGVESAAKQLTLNVVDGDPPEQLRVPTQVIPYRLSGHQYDVQLIATNGTPDYEWSDVAGMLEPTGLSLGSNGVLSGAVTTDGVVPMTWCVKDQQNRSTYANMPIPVIKSTDHLLTFSSGASKFKIIIKREALKTKRCKLIVRALLDAPSSFTFDRNSPAMCQIGYGFIDAAPPVKKEIADTKIVYKVKKADQLTKVIVKRRADGRIKAVFILKNVDYNNTFSSFGLTDRTTKTLTANLPVWIRIGDFCTETKTVTGAIKSKTGKFTKCKAIW